MQSPICTINLTKKSRSGWTWHNLWNLITINFKYKYFHNFVQGFIFNCVSLHDWEKEKWLMKNRFVKLSCPALYMIRSLISHVEQRPNKFSPICHENLLEKSPFILYGSTLCPCSTGKLTVINIGWLLDAAFIF